VSFSHAIKINRTKNKLPMNRRPVISKRWLIIPMPPDPPFFSDPFPETAGLAGLVITYPVATLALKHRELFTNVGVLFPAVADEEAEEFHGCCVVTCWAG
jgi:hypothetical protein